MKRLFILTLAVVCLGLHQEMYAEIKNGYDQEVIKTEKYIWNLNEIAKKVLTTDQRERLEKLLQAAQATAEKLRENQTKTQGLLEKLRIIDPNLYYMIDTIRDREGNETDVYVKLVDRLGQGLRGAINLTQSVENPDVYRSEYGDYTVSVRVIYPSSEESLRILVHELGHVRYQVPHLAVYCKFYKRYYQYQYFKIHEIGHLPHDPSNMSVKTTLKTFKESLRRYKKERKWMQTQENAGIQPGKMR